MIIEQQISILSIIVGIVTVLIAIASIISVILPIIFEKKSKKAWLNYREQIEKEFSKIKADSNIMLARLEKNDEERIKAYELCLSDRDYRAYNNIGVYYLEKSQLENNADESEILRNRARVYVETSLKLMDENGIHDKTYETVLLNYADILDDCKETENAVTICLNVLKLNENNSNAYNLLASIYENKEKNQENESKVKFYIKKAMEKDPNNGFPLLTQAEILLRSYDGSDKKAENVIFELIEKALRLGCPVWRYTSLKCYDKIKRNDRFSSLIKKYQEFDSIIKAQIKTEHFEIL